MKTITSARRRLVAGLALACTGWWAAPPAAHACSRLAIQYRLAASEVPVAGPIVIDAECIEEYCASVQPELQVTLDGQPVAGSLQLLRTGSSLFLSWTPAAELDTGKSYELQLTGDARGTLIPVERAVVASDALSWPAPDLAAIPSTLGAEVEPIGDSYCCPDLVCGAVCFSEQEIPRAVIELEREQGIRPAYPGVVYRLRWRNAAQEEVSSDWDRLAHRVRAVFDHTADAYCATLEQRSLSDGSVQSRALCHDSDPSAGYGEARASVYDPYLLSFGSCPVPPGARRNCDPNRQDCGAPPDRLLEAWCDAVAPDCPTSATIGVQVETCAAHQAYCAAPNEQESESAGEDESDTLPPASSARNDGCQLSSAGAHAGVWLFALGLLLRRRRSLRTVRA